MAVQPLYHATVERQCFRGAGVGGFRRVGFSPLQFCLTEKTLSCANETPIWGTYVEWGPVYSREDLSGVIVTAGDN
jgi:hypothetical protein